MATKAVTAARLRRVARNQQRLVEIEWMADKVLNRVNIGLRQRVRLATELVKTRTVLNISTPVGRSVGPRGGARLEHSKPGEYPRADTTQLMKTIFQVVQSPAKGVYDGFIGTPLDYGLILETRRERSFLRRTLDEMRPQVTRILTGPIK